MLKRIRESYNAIKGAFVKTDLTKRIKTPKNFITEEVFKYSVMAILPGYLLSFYLAVNDYSVINIVTYPVFIFLAIFWGLIYINNKVYRREKAILEHLFVVNQIDSIELINKFVAQIPANSQPHLIGVSPSPELIALMKSVFSFNEKTLADLFVDQRGNTLNWLARLDMNQRETFYRHYLQG